MKNYFSGLFHGRTNRINYLLGPNIVLLMCLIVSVPLAFLNLSETTNTIFSSILVIWWLILSISLVVRRVHDIGKKSIYLLWLLVPLMNIVVGITLLFAAGDKEENQFGKPAPKGLNLRHILGIQ